MIDPMKYKYLVAIMTADKKAYDITQFVEDVSWEEGEDQLAARISFSAKNDKTSKGRISSLAKPGCYAALLYSYNGGKNAEATRGKIVEWNPSARTSGEKFKVKAYDITQFVEDVSWEEGEDQLAARISFSAKNDKTSKGRISSLAKPGCYAALLYSYNGGKNAEATRGKIVEWNPSARTSGEKFKVKAYDVLYDLQESQDHVYFSAGVKTKSAIVQVLKRWGIKVTSYSGPDVKHGKLAYKSEKLGTVVVKILKEAKKKGGIEACLRAVKMNVTVVGFGTNKTVYHFEETQHLTEVNHKISTTGMVTRVKIIGKANDDGCSPVEATVDGKTSYGIRQKIVSRGTNDTLDEAKKEAREILADDGDPKEEITIKLPDIPIIRKGDKIHLKTASISAGYYIVISATHDVDKMLMTLGLKKAPAAKKSSGNKKTKAKSYNVGDIVNFHGGKHYVSSYPDARGYSVGAGKAKITIKGGSGKAHPWHLVTQNWNQTHVWGWVDDGSFD